jgi:Domain of unknown function (DUF4156)
MEDITMFSLRSSHLVIAIVVQAGLAGGCASTRLTDAGQRVTFSKGDPAKSCKEIGPVNSAVPDGSFVRRANHPLDRLEEAKNLARNNAAKIGANYVRWEASTDDGMNVSGTAYQCE